MSHSKVLRRKMLREIEKTAEELGYERDVVTARNHVKFVHRTSGKIVVAISKETPRGKRNTIADLKRCARSQEGGAGV